MSNIYKFFLSINQLFSCNKKPGWGCKNKCGWGWCVYNCHSVSCSNCGNAFKNKDLVKRILKNYFNKYYRLCDIAKIVPTDLNTIVGPNVLDVGKSLYR